MSEINPLSELAGWLRPVAMSMDGTTLTARHTAVEAISVAAIPLPRLVEAAHGLFDDRTRELITIELQNSDPMLSPEGKDELLATIAAAATITRLHSGSDIAAIGLLVQSAAFLGFKPKIAALSNQAARYVAEASARSRQRLGTKPTPQTIKRILQTSAEGGGDVSSSDLQPQNRALSALATRVEDIIAGLNERLALMDEEIDTLWWARSEVSRTAAKRWQDLEPMTRALVAATEVAAMLSHHPAPPAIIAVLNGVASSDPGQMVPLLKLAGSAAAVDVLPKGVEPERLLPITSAGSIAKEMAAEPQALSALIKTRLQLTADMTLSLDAVAEQTLREISILRLLG